MNKTREDNLRIGVWISILEGRYHQILCQGMKDSASQQGVQLLFFNGSAVGSPYIGHNEENAIYRISSPELHDGLILPADTVSNYLSSEELDSLITDFQPKPVVTIGVQQDRVPDISCDNAFGMSLNLRHLIENHRMSRFAFIRGPKNNMDSLQREKGFRDVLAEYRIPLDESLVFDSDFSMMSSFPLVEEILSERSSAIDALVCSNDEVALSLIRLFTKKGIRIPQDFAITGFDNYPSAFLSHPSLTTVHQPIYELGYQSVQQITRMIRGEEVPEKTILAPYLKVRESCGCSLNEIKKEPFLGVSTIQEKSSLKADFSERSLLTDNESILDDIFSEAALKSEKSVNYRKALSDLLDIMVFDIRNRRSQPLCLTVFSEWLTLTLQWKNSNEIWQNILLRLRSALMARINSPTLLEFISEIFLKMLAILSQRVQYTEIQQFYNLEEFVYDLEHMMYSLQECSNEKELLLVLKRDMAVIFPGFFAVILLEQYPQVLEELSDQDKVTPSIVMMSNRDWNENTSMESFQASGFLPSTLLKEMPDMNLVVMEIYHKKDHFGYLVMEVSDREHVMYRLIHNQIASALAGITRHREKSAQHKAQENMLRQRVHEIEQFKWILDNMSIHALVINEQLDVIFATSAFQQDCPGENLEGTVSMSDCETLKSWIKGFDDAPSLTHIHSNSGKVWPLLNAVRQEGTGVVFLLDESFFKESSALRLKPFFREYQLTPREREIVQLLVTGQTVREVAENLFIAESTVKSHIKDLYRKLEIGSRSELLSVITRTLGTNIGEERLYRELLDYFLSTH